MRLKVSGAANAKWREMIGRFDNASPNEKIKYVQNIEKVRFPDFEKIIDENNRQFIEEIHPLYRKMVKHFLENMSLATSVTREHFGALVEFVEIWNRWLDKTIPQEVIPLLGHSEDKLKPFYQDLSYHMESLSSELDK